jgi:hypothetical protein
MIFPTSGQKADDHRESNGFDRLDMMPFYFCAD